MNGPEKIFIDQPIQVFFSAPVLLEKTPSCPDAFLWEGRRHLIIEIISEWRNYQRRGRMDRNMSLEHAARASMKGSWGVGRFFFQVRVEDGRVFELYYDRAPKSVDDRMGHWFLLTECSPDSKN